MTALLEYWPAIGFAALVIVGAICWKRYKPHMRVLVPVRRYVRRGRKRWEYGVKDAGGHRIPLGGAASAEQALQRLAEETKDFGGGV